MATPDADHLQGSMIALMPTAADAQRLALEGGEAAEDLHCTLAYLGPDATVFSPDDRSMLVECLREYVWDLLVIEANIFGAAHWNGGGESPSWVWSVGDGAAGSLDSAHASAQHALALSGVPLPTEAHTPWVAHICAEYTDNLTLVRELEQRLGPVTFDRVRISFGDEDHDLPLAAAVGAESLQAAGTLRRQLNDAERASTWDYAAHQWGWQTAVNQAVAQYAAYSDAWRLEIKRQITAAGEDPSALDYLHVDTTEATVALLRRMTDLAQTAGNAQQREAERQGVKVPDWTLDSLTAALPGTAVLRNVADMTANILGSSMIQSAKRYALRVIGVKSGQSLASDVDSHLSKLSPSSTRESIGGAMTSAQNVGRLAVLEASPEASYYASESLDKNTCKPCIAIDGTEFTSLGAAREAYPAGGYASCQGGGRCRGTMVAVWSQSETASAAPDEGAHIMPWHTVQGHSECISAKPWAVVKDSDGSVAGCHETQEKANNQLAALYAAEGEAAVGAVEELAKGEPNPGTEKDKRLKENQKKGSAAGGHESLAGDDCPPGMEMDPKSGKCIKVALAIEPVGELSSETAPWRGPLTVEGIETGDGREFDAGSLQWADLPLPLRWNKEDSHGGTPRTLTVNVGRIDKIWREEASGLVMGEGLLDLGNADGKEVYRKIEGKFLRGVSVDVDSIKDADMELVWATDPDSPDGEMDPFEQMFASPEKVVFHAGRIRAATLVDIPAFAEAYIALTDDEGGIVAGGEPIGALRAGRIPVLKRPAALRAADWQPPAGWFTNPDLSVPTPITVDSEGRVYGHAALWGTCHIGQEGLCVTPPQEDSHPYFMTGAVFTDDGTSRSVGQITVGTGHAPINLGSRAAAEHYDNTGAAVADVAVGNDVHGIWVAGSVRAGADSTRVHELRAAGQVSGDWRRIGGALRLVGLLAVNVPGFPVPKLATKYASGVQFALVASGIPDLTESMTEAELDQWAYRRIMTKLAAKVHGEE